jgi:hypothetical protein
MKHFTRFFLSAVFVALCSFNVFAEGFEGILTMNITSAKMEKPMTMMITTKGEKSVVSMEMPQGAMKMYVDHSTGKMVTVMESMKMGMEMDLKKMEEMTKNSEAAPKIEATNEKKVINGHNCELYRITSAKGDVSNMWMTDDLPKSLLNTMQSAFKNGLDGGMRGQKNNATTAAMKSLFEKGLVPIQIESLHDGKVETTITFIKYEQKKLDDSIFIVPSDIKIRQMPSFMGGGAKGTGGE